MIVVECAAVVDALTALAGSEALQARLTAEDLHAPGLVDFEIVSALRGLTRRGHLSVARARDLLFDYDALPLQRWACADPLRQRAFQLRDNVCAHDAAYIALAEALNCPLVTRDRRLARSTGHAATIELA